VVAAEQLTSPQRRVDWFPRSLGRHAKTKDARLLVKAAGHARVWYVHLCDTWARGWVAGVRHQELVGVVDSDALARAAVVEVLRSAGHCTIEAVTGEGALRRMERTTRPVILVAEARLYGVTTGLELAATACSLWPHSGIVLMGRRPPPGVSGLLNGSSLGLL
jgi:hypothetical protein